MIDFNCVYEDQYKVSAEGGITPAITTVDAKTGLGNFTVELGLYRDQTFLQPYSENPVVKISNDVCVQLELKVLELSFAKVPTSCQKYWQF